MRVLKNVQFSLLVKIEGRVREFNFRKRSDTCYDGDVSDEKGERWSFVWKLVDSNWHLEPKETKTSSFPLWIVSNISAIRECFLTELL